MTKTPPAPDVKTNVVQFKKAPMKVGYKILAWAKTFLNHENTPDATAVFRPPTLPAGVAPKEDMLAMDSSLCDVYAYANQMGCGEGFMGYPALAELTQKPEYRMLSEKTAQAMCRMWIEFTSKGDGDKSDKIAAIEAEFERLKVRDLFREAKTYDGFFGRCQLYIDVGVPIDDASELGQPLLLDKAKIGIGKLRKFKLIEPMYTYPNEYSASSPLADDYYNPRSWYVMGKRVHASRLMTFVSAPVPDMLKPAYNFGGLSMSQLSKPYVDNWIRTRTSVGRLVSAFSTMGVKTDMSTMLLGLGEGGQDGDDLMNRAQLFTAMRDNLGLLVMDKDSEEFFQVDTTLTTLDKLQAQAQEHMASVSSTPTSILLGITPTGLNASTDGEIRTYYDHVLSLQNLVFADPLTKVLKIVQLSLFGVIDDDIGFKFVPLWQQNETELAANRKSDAETANIYFQMGAISNGEVRKKLGDDSASGYTGLEEVTDLPTPGSEDDQDGGADGPGQADGVAD